MATTVLASLLGIVFYLFLFWKKLKEDYTQEQIFSTALVTLILFLVVYLVTLRFLGSWWFWLSLLAGLIGTLFGIVKFKLRVFETFEAFILSVLPWLSIIFLRDSIVNFSLTSFLAFCLIIILIGLFFFFDAHYRGFSWYRSGRVGFSGLTIAGIFFTLRALVAQFYPYVLSLVKGVEVWLSGVFAFLIFLVIFNLSRKNI